MSPSKLFINCLPTLAPFLKQEVEALGYAVKDVDKTGVTIQGGWREVLHLNLHLRTASRVLWLIRSFEADHPDQLYEQAKKIAWHRLMPPDGYFSVQSFVHNDHIRDNRFANLRLKDAIVDRMQAELGSRPDSGPNRDRTVIQLYWTGQKVSIYFDTSGETIAKHGYRQMSHAAPMLESLASASLIAAGWHADRGSLVNPMCGSGTLAIEAALMATGMPAGLHRQGFGFMHISSYRPEQWEDLLDSVTFKRQLAHRIIATDHDQQSVKSARINAKAAGVEHLIDFDTVDFEETEIPEGPGLVILNPEYGERLGEEEDLVGVYRDIGTFFKQKCQGKTGYIFTGNPKLAKEVGLSAKRKIEFLNGKIDCRLISYELYQGTRRAESE